MTYQLTPINATSTKLHRVYDEDRLPFYLPRSSTGHFATLAESILHQQLAGAAARAIHRRFVALFDGDPSPEAVLSIPPRKPRAAGLSGRKVVSMRDLAAKVVDGTVPLHRIGRLASRPGAA